MGGSLTVTPAEGLLANDAGAPPLAASGPLGSEAGGELTVRDDGGFDYIPPESFFGEDGFTYTLTDGNGGTVTAAVRLVVVPALASLSLLADGAAGFPLDGEGTDHRLGGAVASAGDVNGDGLDDLVVGARRASPNGDQSGRAYVVFGRSDGVAPTVASVAAGTGGFVIDGEGAQLEAGWGVAAAGDVNADGLDDVLVTSSRANTEAGRTYVVFGKAGTDPVSLADVTTGEGGFAIDGESAQDRSGAAAAGAGDVNGDGFDDIIIGAAFATGGATDSGRSYVVFGKATTARVDLGDIADGDGGFVIDGVAANDRTGQAVCGGGDVDGDGLDDLVVGAVSVPDRTYAGRAYVLFGKEDTDRVSLGDIGDTVAGFHIDGPEASHYAGHVACGAGDVNGDGLADLLVGAYGYDDFTGRAYVVFGKADQGVVELADVAGGEGGFVIEGTATFDSFGVAGRGAGDVDGDGLDDLVIGARLHPGDARRGRAYLVFGKDDTAALGEQDLAEGDGGFALHGEDEGDEAGASVAGAGDFDGDGLADLVVGAPYAGASGRAYLVFGADLRGAVTGLGTPLGDSLFAALGAGKDVLLGQRGEDTLHADGGLDVLLGGAGDDRLVVTDGAFLRVDGGGGVDTLALGTNGLSLDLVAAQARVRSVEVVDLGGAGDNTLRLSMAAARRLPRGTHTLTVLGDAGDAVTVVTQGATSSSGGGFVTYALGPIHLAIADALSVTEE